MKNIFAVLVLLFSTTYFAQSQAFPEKAASIGFQITQGEFGYGPVLNYAASSNLHIGTQLGLYYDNGYQNNNVDVIKSNFFFYLAPYAKYYFSNIKNFRPFIQGQIAIFTIQDYLNATPQSQGSTNNSSGNALWINVGGSWFPFNNLGVNAGIRFIDFNFDHSWLKMGLGNPFIGIDWYL